MTSVSLGFWSSGDQQPGKAIESHRMTRTAQNPWIQWPPSDVAEGVPSAIAKGWTDFQVLCSTQISQSSRLLSSPSPRLCNACKWQHPKPNLSFQASMLLSSAHTRCLTHPVLRALFLLLTLPNSQHQLFPKLSCLPSSCLFSSINTYKEVIPTAACTRKKYLY